MKDEGTPQTDEFLPYLLKKVVAGIGITMSVYHLYAVTSALPRLFFIDRSTCFSPCCDLFSQSFLQPSRGEKYRWADGILILLTLASIGYLFINYEYVITRYPYVHL